MTRLLTTPLEDLQARLRSVEAKARAAGLDVDVQRRVIEDAHVTLGVVEAFIPNDEEGGDAE